MLINETDSHADGGRSVQADVAALFIARLPQRFLVHLFLETDQHRFAHDQCWSAKISGRAKNQLEDFFFGVRLCLSIDIDSFFAFGDEEFVDPRDQLQSFIFLVLFLFGVDFGLRSNVSVGKKLLRFSARFSARTMVAPT